MCIFFCLHSVRLFDTCGQQLLDTLLGMAFMLYVIDSSCADTIATSVMYWADVSVQLLPAFVFQCSCSPNGLSQRLLSLVDVS